MPKVSQHKRRVIPEMSTTTHAHPGLTTAQETVQVVLLIIFSVVGKFRVHLLLHNVSPLFVVQLCAELNGGRYLEAKTKEADGGFVTKLVVLPLCRRALCRPER